MMILGILGRYSGDVFWIKRNFLFNDQTELRIDFHTGCPSSSFQQCRNVAPPHQHLLISDLLLGTIFLRIEQSLCHFDLHFFVVTDTECCFLY